MQKLLLIPKGCFYLTLACLGYVWYLISGKTPWVSFISMRRLFCVTNGYSNDVTTEIARRLSPPYPMPEASGVLGQLSEKQCAEIGEKLRSEGYHQFDIRLDPETQRELRRFAETTPCHPMLGWELAEPTLYDPDHPISPKYDFDAKVLLRNPLIQKLVADKSLMGVAQAYFGSKALFDYVCMWWSTAQLGRASVEAAQLYHFDMDRLKFLKFFFYLTDVDAATGPHCFIARTHRRIPRPLLRIERIQDEEIARYYPPEAFQELTGIAGTILAVDTRGFHKGKPLVHGHRLILQIQFTTSLFGNNYGKVAIPPAEVCGELRQGMERYPSAFPTLVTK